TGQAILKMSDAINLPVKTNYINFGIYEGVKGLFLSKSGEIYFGGNYGLNVLSTEDITQNPYPPAIVLTKLKIFNKDVIIGKEDSPLEKHIAETQKIKLTHEQSVFTFEFAALNYIFPEKNKYAFIMEGFEKEWNYVGNQHSATYTNLDPGEYVFRVKGSNNDDVWNEKGVSVQIKIIPPWWKTYWAYLFYVLSFGLLLFSIWRFQLNKARMKHELALEHLHAEKLEEINRMKSCFFSSVTHEFRTPLTLIMGLIQQIFANDLDGRFKDQCKMIIRNSQKLYQLINQLLDLSKLEAGYMPLRTKRENIIPLLNEFVVLFSPLAERKQVGIDFTVCGDSDNNKDSIDVYLDQEKFEKIISNLLLNAIKFTPEGGDIQIYVQKYAAGNTKIISNGKDNFQVKNKLRNKIIRQKGKQLSNLDIIKLSKQFNQGYVEIIVKDNGIGCPENCIDKIFDRFYRVDDTLASKHEGTGIGLALTKELVELHYGTIAVESVCGKGTTFTVRLPLGKDHLKEAEITNDPIDCEHDGYINEPLFDEMHDDSYIDKVVKSKSDSRKKLPILLIVEDNVDFRKYLYDYLNHDYQVIEAKDGKEGLEKSIEQIPDLIVSDVMMPGINGFELCQKVKSDERTSHIPVILLTVKASEESKIEGLETGADDYMTKPFEIKELKVRIRNLIDQRWQLRMRFNRKQGLKPEEIATTSVDEKFLRKALAIIEQKMSDPDFSVQEFAKEIALSRVQLHRKLRSLTGQSTTEFIRVVRLNRAAQLLKQNHESVTQIAYLVGFNSSSYFSRSFYKHFGVSPSEYASSKSQL
ncbi:MAG: response regulator, partial [bacterium]